MVIARFRAQSASTPPPCPLPSGGGWPRARPCALSARHVAARAQSLALPTLLPPLAQLSLLSRQQRYAQGEALAPLSLRYRFARAHPFYPLTALRARHFCLPNVFSAFRPRIYFIGLRRFWRGSSAFGRSGHGLRPSPLGDRLAPRICGLPRLGAPRRGSFVV